MLCAICRLRVQEIVAGCQSCNRMHLKRPTTTHHWLQAILCLTAAGNRRCSRPGWERGSSGRVGGRELGAPVREGPPPWVRERDQARADAVLGPPSWVGDRELGSSGAGSAFLGVGEGAPSFHISLRSRGQAPGPPTKFWVGSCEAEREHRPGGREGAPCGWERGTLGSSEREGAPFE